MNGNIKNEIGHRYGKLTVVSFVPEGKKLAVWNCLCDCGNAVQVTGHALRIGNTTSCGCMRIVRAAELGRKNVVHGHARFGAVTPEYQLWINASRRAKRSGVEFTIVPDDIKIPETCPLLGIKLHAGIGKHLAESPSLDRFDSTKGYTQENIWVISFRANSWKSNFTLTELKKMVIILEQREQTNEASVQERTECVAASC